ncbi:hypothetical protein [Haloparvum sedimenti]|uniref:hypothetical protein n=1 Tax=Haloparvum sedimenti TaxID=1678448 RepID=UPI00071E731B|nr:hypothetical protein [Haloparvum sedimenti]
MENGIYLALAAAACLGFAATNFALNDGGILPGWILLGVLFAVAGVASVVLGEDDGASGSTGA